MKSKGFTLIELLVVVAIIGVLASIILSSLSNARAKARDARRLADIRNFQTALEIYYLDNGQYPLGGWHYSNDATWQTLETEMGVTLPQDPVNNTGQVNVSPFTTLTYGYYSSSATGYCNGNVYLLVYNLETQTDSDNKRILLCNGGYTTHFGPAFVVSNQPFW